MVYDVHDSFHSGRFSLGFDDNDTLGSLSGVWVRG